VVVVEDDADSRRATERVLVANGYDVKSASTVKEALYLIERYGCDLLLSDVLLPDGTALELMRTLADADAAPKAIAMAGKLSIDRQAEFADAGFTGFVAKPVLFTQLLTEVERALTH